MCVFLQWCFLRERLVTITRCSKSMWNWTVYSHQMQPDSQKGADRAPGKLCLLAQPTLLLIAGLCFDYLLLHLLSRSCSSWTCSENQTRPGRCHHLGPWDSTGHHWHMNLRSRGPLWSSSCRSSVTEHTLAQGFRTPTWASAGSCVDLVWNTHIPLPSLCLHMDSSPSS